jgi:hypothetical protein
MRTLVQPIARWLTQGQSPRTFVRITNSAGTEILFSGTQVLGTAIDDIESFGNISKSIKQEGGASEVSTASVRNLILSNRLPLCTESELNTRRELQGANTYIGAGRILSQSLPYGTYASARNATTGEFSEVALVVGRAYSATPLPVYSVYRSPLQYLLPTITTCDDTYIELTGLGLHSTPSLKMGVVEGNWADMSNPAGMFNYFENWAASGTYAVTLLNEEWTAAEYDTTCRIRFNQAGRDKIVAKSGALLKLMLIAYRDYTYGTDPTTSEYVQFAANPTLKIRSDSFTLENQTAAIYYGVAPLPADYTGMDLMSSGVVDSFEISDRNLSIESRQNDFKKNVMLPRSVILAADYPLAHESIIGEAVPIVYGDFQTTRLHQKGIPNSVNQTTSVEYGIQDMVKAYVYEKSTAGVMKAVIANHAIKTLGNAIAIYESGIKEYAQLTGDVAAIAGADNSKITIQGNGGGAAQFPYDLTGDTVQPIIGYVPLDAQEFMAEPNTSLNCINTNISDYTTFLANDRCDYWLNMTNWHEGYGVSSLNVNRYLCFKTIADAGYDAGFHLSTQYYDFDNTVHTIADVLINSDGWHYIDITGLPDQEILSYMFELHNNGSKTVKVYNIAFFTGYKKDVQGEIFISVQGMPDDGTGIITGTPSTLIENPAHIIESIARGGTGIDGKAWGLQLTTAEIDTAAFDTASTALGTSKFAFQLLEQKKSIDLLDELAFQAGLFIFWDSQDRLKIKRFNSADTFPNSATDIPGLMDTFTDTGLPVNDSFTTHQILSGLTLSKMKISDVKNDFILNYAYNYGSKQYAKTLRVNKDEENLDETICGDLGTTGAAMKLLCSDSYTAIKAVNTFTYDCWAIRDETTATALMKHLIERLSVMRWMVEFEAGDSAVLFEECDFINIRNDLIENRFGTATMNVKKWMVIKIDSDPRTHNVSLKCIEV